MAHKISIIDKQTVPDLLWNEFPGNPFNEDTIGKIEDNVGNRPIPVTSIPSPLAQMHLFDTAFKFINENYKLARKRGVDPQSELAGNTIYHKCVSSCLDLFEIMYSIRVLGLDQKIRIQNWTSAVLDDLAVASAAGIQTFAKTLKSYINNYNNDFKKIARIEQPLSQLILIFYEDKVIGGTSPWTGFFTMSDDLPTNIRNHDNTQFFQDIIPLYKRNKEFIVYLTWIFETDPTAPTVFKGLHQYIRNNSNHTPEPLKSLLNRIGNSPESLSDEEKPKYEELNINNQPLYLYGTTCQYGSKPLGDFKAELKESDYAVNTGKCGKELPYPPIMLIRNSNKAGWKYYKGPMPQEINPDTLLGIDVRRRKIPAHNIEYPCLGINDLLSQHIIQLSDYNINSQKYWTIDHADCMNLLPPVKPTYFDYFTIKDLEKNLRIVRLSSGSVHVTLRIQVKGDNGNGVIEFERTYSQVNPENIEHESKGAIINARFGLGIYPFFRVSDNRYNDFYKISQYYDSSTVEDVSCKFYRQDSKGDRSIPIEKNMEFERTKREEGLLYISKYTELAKYSMDKSLSKNAGTAENIRFDFVSVEFKVKGVKVDGVIIPRWGAEVLLNQSGSISFDIGTSNTHVAYAIDGGSPVSISNFDSRYGSTAPHMVFLQEPSQNLKDSKRFDFNERNISEFREPQYTEFMPSVVGPDSSYAFPIRSVVNQDNDTDPSQVSNLSPLINMNIPFAFSEINMREKFDKTYSHLKWGTSDPKETDVRNRLQIFIDQLALMGRNKLLQEGVDPSRTNVIWFKPLSMGVHQSTIFKEIWDRIYIKYFGKNSSEDSLLHSVTESWAPYFSYSMSWGQGKTFLNIDIGGGTTDILAFKDGLPLLTTSFRFAGDNLYDDGLNVKPAKDNGIYLKYEHIGRSLFNEGKDLIKSNIIKYISKQPNLRSSDLMMFFLTQQEMVEKLKLDKDMQLIFLLHHASLFYHTAQILKMKDFEIPGKIGLSGNGAKLLSITNRDKNLNREKGIRMLVEKIFQKVYELPDQPRIELHTNEHPKDATAEGGVIGLPIIRVNPHADTDVYYYSLGDDKTLIDGNNGRMRHSFKYKEFLNNGDDRIENVASNVIGFLKFFYDELWFDCSFTTNFGLNKSLVHEKIRKYCVDKSKIKSALNTAVQNKIGHEKENELNETMFFYPIRAMIYDLSKLLNNDKDMEKFTTQ